MGNIKYLQSHGNKLSYAYTAPVQQEIQAGVIFVHAADGNRLGPHRMFVEAANKFKECGIASVRFDMRGCGDSEGQCAGDDMSADIEDLLATIRYYAENYQPVQIYLFGISRGARVCISALAEHGLPVDGAILLSTPLSSPKTAVKITQSRFREYLYKLTNWQYLKKLLSGKANIRQIGRTLAAALGSAKRYRRRVDGFATKCPLFFVYGSKDPIAADASLYYKKLCERFNIAFQITTIENANHSFFHYRWKEHILDIAEQWIKDINGNGSLS